MVRVVADGIQHGLCILVVRIETDYFLNGERIQKSEVQGDLGVRVQDSQS